MKSPKVLSRTAGYLYLFLILSKIFSEFFIRGNLISWGDPTETAQRILASEFLFRLGFVVDLVAEACFLTLIILVYQLFKHVNKTFAIVMASCVLVNVAIQSLNMVHEYAALVILKGSGGYLAVFDPDQLNALSLFFLKLWGIGFNVAAVFYSLWLLPLGYLVLKSGFDNFSRILGWWLMITCFALFINFFTRFLYPGSFRNIIFTVAHIIDLSEIVFCVWLLVRRVKASENE